MERVPAIRLQVFTFMAKNAFLAFQSLTTAQNVQTQQERFCASLVVKELTCRQIMIRACSVLLIAMSVTQQDAHSVLWDTT
jgi:hypothetical protein